MPCFGYTSSGLRCGTATTRFQTLIATVVFQTILIATAALLAIFCSSPVHGAPPTAASRNTTSPNSQRGKTLRIESGERTPSPLEDDAQLHAVCVRPSGVAIACGNHGVIWRSETDGESWELQTSGTTARLRSIQFVTDELGWIAGGYREPLTQASIGVLLTTTNGGQTWTSMPIPGITQIQLVQFFSPEQGLLVCEPSAGNPTGIKLTANGGQSWTNAPGSAAAAWRAAAFAQPNVGALVGPRTQIGKFVDGALESVTTAGDGLMAFNAVVLNEQERGWLVGDRGSVRQTTNGGLAWTEPQTPLPDLVRNSCDFQAVAILGKHVWIAGSPGSCIWHSSDDGVTWRVQQTGQTLPLSAITFVDAQRGIAVGQLGCILTTSNGGSTWETRRGENRRAAFAAVLTEMNESSVLVTTQLGGELGYRGVTAIVGRDTAKPSQRSIADEEALFDEAATLAGGATAVQFSRYPLSVPQLRRNRDSLLADWNSRTDSTAEAALRQDLVQLIRTWQPNVVLLEIPADDDAAASLVFDRAVQATTAAADETQYLELNDVLGLRPWSIDRIVVRLPDGSSGPIRIAPDDFLSRTGLSLQMAAATPVGVLFARLPGQTTLTFRELSANDSSEVAPQAATGSAPAAAGSSSRNGSQTAKKRGELRSVFQGLSIPPGSPARRELPAVDAELATRNMETAVRVRNQQAILTQQAQDRVLASGLISSIDSFMADMPREMAALQLHQLASTHIENGNLDLAESAYVELAERFPDQPAGRSALVWLMRYWASLETNWQRFRPAYLAAGSRTIAPDDTAPRIAAALQQLAQQRSNLKSGVLSELAPQPLDAITQFDPVKDSRKPVRNGLEQRIAQWHGRSAAAAEILRVNSPELYATSEVQWIITGLARMHPDWPIASTVSETVLQVAGDTTASPKVTQAVATVTSPRNEISCYRAAVPPKLDGVLTDPCWQAATEIVLSNHNGSPLAGPSRRAVAFLSYDSEYLYFAAVVPRAAGVPTDGTYTFRRQHDADVTPYDRVTLQLDIDRDYGTAYEFTIDQRGCTFDKLWTSAQWNPKWYVASTAEKETYRVEAAIPWNELTPVPPGPNVVYGLNAVRVAPGVGIESWGSPSSESPVPEAFGNVRFEK